MIASGEFYTVLENYLDAHPGERDLLAPALRLLGAGRDLSHRGCFPAHATVGALVLDEQANVLVVEHRAYGILLQPGGHIERGDKDLVHASLRELAEETGIDPDQVSVLSTAPVYAAYGEVPARQDRDEPAHWHLDLGYAFTIRGVRPTLTPQADEIATAAWHPRDQAAEILPEEVGRALRALPTLP
jgi:8-oxo-dGTP pyrophosphatase MutT (NUDIX family)